MKVTKGMYLKYKYSPDDVTIFVKRVIFADATRVEFLGLCDGYETTFTITKENEKGWLVC